MFHLKKIKSVFSVINSSLMLVLQEKSNGSIQLTSARVICDLFFSQLSHSDLFHLCSSGSPPMPFLIFTSYVNSSFYSSFGLCPDHRALVSLKAQDSTILIPQGSEGFLEHIDASFLPTYLLFY